jgi:hypothetical protein
LPWSWVLGLTLIGLACAPAPVTRPGWRPDGGVAPLLSPSSDPRPQLTNLLAECRVTLVQDNQRQFATGVIRLSGPDLARLDVRGPLATHLFSALVERDSLILWGPQAQGAWKGSIDGPLLARLTGVELAGYDPVRALLGLVRPADPATVPVVNARRRGRVEVTLAEAGDQRHLWIDLAHGLVCREVVCDVDGGVVLDRRLERYRDVGGALLPARVTLQSPSGARLLLEFRRWVPGGAPDAARLQRDVPRVGLSRWGADDTVEPWP